MSFYADLHIHSKYSRATSRDCDLEHLAWWAGRKGISVVGTGDFTHPAWFEEIRTKLVPDGTGLFRLRDDLERERLRRLPPSCHGEVRFMLSVEISTIYKKGDKTRKIHHLIYAPDLDTAGRFNAKLGAIGNIRSDGRPILGLDSRHLLEIALESGEGAYLVPAHIWTPWFAVMGSKSGFDAVDDCYADLASHVFAVETGLSSDPCMNWRVSSLDRFRLVSNSDAHSPPMLGREACVFDGDRSYWEIRRALETGERYGGTVEFFPEEGKYHLDGHRKCDVRLSPEETRERGGACPVCGKPVTVGVMHRVSELADREDGFRLEGAAGFRSLVPLPELMSEIAGVGPKSKRVARDVTALVDRLGPELHILEEQPIEDIDRLVSPVVSESIARLRRGEVHREAGYDGEYGVIRMFRPEELDDRPKVPVLFDLEESTASAQKPEAPVATPPSPPPRAPVVAAETLDLFGSADAGAADPLGGLDPHQREAAACGGGPLLVLAGPGTGKTRTLTHRIAHLVRQGQAAAGECLAITFTRKAARELEERLEGLLPADHGDVAVGTFHSTGLEILREQRVAAGLHRGFAVADEAQRIEVVRAATGLTAKRARGLIADFGAWARGEGEPDAERRELRERYRAALQERNWIDFDDLIALPVALLEEDADVRAQYRARFKWVFVDEYQDVDALQYRMVRALCPQDGSLTVIGDPDQAIYGFRGADVRFFLHFEKDFQQVRRVELSRNYRSSPVIVDGALEAIAPSTLARGRRLDALSAGEAPPRIVVHSARSDRAEAEFVAHSIEKLIGGYSYFSVDSGRVGDGEAADLGFADIAVLYRTDAQSRVLVEALARAGIPIQKRSHGRLVDHAGVQRLVDVLQQSVSEDPQDGGVNLALERASEEAVRRGLARSRARNRGAVEEALRAEVAEAHEWLAPLAARCPEPARFLDELALGAEMDSWDPRADRVSLLTLHASKGLEFRAVFLTGCEEGLLPLRAPGLDGRTAAARREAEKEERRLFFVGMTRARSHLFLSHARRRRGREALPSPFLTDIDEGRLDRQVAEARKARAATATQIELL